MKPFVDYHTSFDLLDIRVGTIVKAEPFPRAKKPSYRLEIDFGPELGIRRSSAQITAHYAIEDLKGRQIIAVVNFPSRNIAGFLSEVLVLGVYDTDQNVVLLTPDKPLPDGSVIG